MVAAWSNGKGEIVSRPFLELVLIFVSQIAQNLGLSRLSPELPREASVEDIKRTFGSRWEMAADREIARRIWWTLVCSRERKPKRFEALTRVFAVFDV